MSEETLIQQHAVNEIVVYQPDDVLRIEVKLQNDSVWLTQAQMAELFACSTDNISLHLKNIFSCGELEKDSTSEESSVVQYEGSRRVTRTVRFYNLDAIISVGYRVNSMRGVKFRQWATAVLKEYLLRGYAVHHRLELLKEKIDARLDTHEQEIAELKCNVDFLLNTHDFPREGVFLDGQIWDACSLAERLVGSAKQSILLIDDWVDATTLDMLAKKRPGVVADIYTSKRGCRLVQSDIRKFNAQYGCLNIKYTAVFHDRFVIIDDSMIFLFGASLKDLGKKCFAFTELAVDNIARIKERLAQES